MHVDRRKSSMGKCLRKGSLGLMLIGFAGSTSVAPAATWYVAEGGADTGHDGHSWDQAFLTISNAIAKASATTPDTILVSNGTYNITAQIAVTKPLALTGIDGWSNTMVRGNASFGCFTINNTSAVVRGFTITNGVAPTYGGGVKLDNGAVLDCLITGNVAARGGGVSMTAGATYSLVSNCIIRANLAWTNQSWASGGGVWMSAGRMIDCVIDSNLNTNRTTSGGGVDVQGGEYMAGCTITRNTSCVSGGGLYVATGFALTNCHVDQNYAAGYGGGVYAVAALTFTGGSVNSNAIGSYYGAGINASANLTVSNASISGNVLTNAWGGAGVDYTGPNAVFVNCDLNDNRVTSLPVVRQQWGGALYFRGSNLTVRDCRLIGNSVVNSNNVMGGAIASPGNKGTVLIENCVIQSNSVSCLNAGVNCHGGGLYISSNAVIRNCRISANRAALETDGTGAVGSGGGIYMVSNNNPNVIESCTIAGNYAQDSGGGVSLAGDGLDEVWNCVVYSNYNATTSTNWYLGNGARRARVHYTCTPETMSGTGNITGEPRFINPAMNDYRLQGGSPGINTGTIRAWMTAALDLDGNPRVDQGSLKVDMGCYEYVFPGGTLITLR